MGRRKTTGYRWFDGKMQQSISESATNTRHSRDDQVYGHESYLFERCLDFIGFESQPPSVTLVEGKISPDTVVT